MLFNFNQEGITMKSSNTKLSIEEVLRGLKKNEIALAKTLLPNTGITADGLHNAIKSLTPEHQWIIDGYLERARRIQRIRFYLKRSLAISILIMAAVSTALIILIYTN